MKLPSGRTNERRYTAVHFGSNDNLNLSSKPSNNGKKNLITRILDIILAPFRWLKAFFSCNKHEVLTAQKGAINDTKPIISDFNTRVSEDKQSKKEFRPSDPEAPPNARPFQPENRAQSDLQQKLRDSTERLEKNTREAEQIMEEHNRIVRPSYLDVHQDLEYMDAQLRQLELQNEIHEDERRRYLQSRNRQ